MNLEFVSHLAQGQAKPNPLLFVHGAWHGAWCWQITFMPYFAACSYDTYAFSLRGHGSSDGRRSLPVTRLADYLDDLRMILARFDKPPILIGHSTGALVIQKLLQKPNNIPAVVFLAPIPPFGTGGLVWRTIRQRPRTALRVLLTQDVYYKVATPEPDGRTFFSPHMPVNEAEGYRRRFTRESFVAVGLDALVLDLPWCPRIDCPVLVMGGRYDTLFTPAEIRRTARTYGTQAVIMPNMGHELMLDPGWEIVANTIDSWLTRIFH